MWEVNGRVTQTALAIRDADELEVAASVLDAALRRAKADVLQEVMELCLRDPLFKQFVEKGFWGAHHVDIVWRHNGQDKQHEADWLKSLWYLLRKLDARAAQIEREE